MSDFNDNGNFYNDIDGENDNDTEKEANAETEMNVPDNKFSDESVKPAAGYNQPRQTNAGEYDNRSTYPYSNSQYPYGNSGVNNQNKNPYSNQNQQQYGTDYYNYNRPQENQFNSYYNTQNGGYAYGQNNQPPKKSGKGRTAFIVVAVVLLVLIVGGIVIGLSGGNNVTPSTESTESTKPTELNVEEFSSNSTPEIEKTTSAKGELSPNEIYEKVKESSVGILVYDSTKALSSEGTGVVMTADKDGKYTYVVTCAHVISDKNVSIMVQLFSGKEYSATVIGYDAKTDIGVLRIEASGLQIADFGDSSKLGVGDTVYAIGNPGGTEFANSFTNGMISAIDRPVSSSATGYTMECVQHTAAINPGNSGGALVNAFGQVIGINSMKIVSDEYEGMGFAVPSSVFIDIVNEIIKNGYVANRPKLGITYVSASTQQSYAMYVAIKGLPAGSIIIYSISEDSDLVSTDVKEGDMIVSVNGKGLDDASDLSEVIENSKVGDTLTLGIVRINNDYTAKEFSVKVKLVEDRGDTMIEEETTTSIYDSFFNGGSNGSDNYDDFFNDFFGRYFQSP